MPRIRGGVCTLVVATTLIAFAGVAIPVGGASAGTPPSIDGYQNPLRSVVSLVPDRIDQGVDYTGMGKVYTLGPGVITYVDTTGAWFPPAPDYIAYQLTSGTASGLTVYVAECITPKARIKVGLTVGVNTVIGNMTTKNCSYGIETGWANAEFAARHHGCGVLQQRPHLRLRERRKRLRDELLPPAPSFGGTAGEDGRAQGLPHSGQRRHARLAGVTTGRGCCSAHALAHPRRSADTGIRANKSGDRLIWVLPTSTEALFDFWL